MSERQLVEQLSGNPAEAFEVLVRRYGRRLHAIGYRILGDVQDAEDVVQETLLKVFESIHTFRSDASLYTWLYRIATNFALTRLRKERRHETLPIEPYLPQYNHGQHVGEIEDWSHLPDEEASAAELSRFFQQCLGELPEDYRVAYILKDIEKFSEEEVAEILNVTKAAMKNRVHRARVVIRQRIQERFPQVKR
jgi:RNA polymerase sigma-70 factor, ECF subfamily